jgi:predicted transcriptional regulator
MGANNNQSKEDNMIAYAKHFALKTVSDVKAYHEELAAPNAHFFDRKTMKFHGDKMKDFGIYTDDEGYRCIYRKNGRPAHWRLQPNGHFRSISKED